MVPMTSLWLPILLSAVAVFVASSLVHMVLRYHRTDYAKVTNEDAVMEALRPTPPGNYFVPFGEGPEAMKDPAFVEKMKRGAVAIVMVLPAGPPSMGKNLGQWFVYVLVISAFVAYVAGRAVAPGAAYPEVFRFAGTAAFLGYAMGAPQDSIWFGRKWSTTVKNLVDGLIYALLTAGVFGWLWP